MTPTGNDFDWEIGVNMSRSVPPLAATAAAVLVAACASETSNEGVVARIDDYELSVDEAVDLLVDEERLASDVGVVESLAELWIDYTLLAEAAADDTTFANVDVDPLIMREVQQMMVFQLRDSVLQVDTFVTDEELRAMYEEESPEVEVRARHIMLQLPVDADQAARDSVAAELAELRQRILDGADFATLARQLSQDPGTAPQGGDLGFFGRGEMVAPFEQAVLALEPGELSDVVRTPMGLHLIRLDDRRVRSFEEAGPRYRQRVQARMVQQAESTFVSDLVDQVDPRVTDGALEIAREMASNPGAGLTGRAARRALVEWDGGAISVGDVREILQMESPNLRNQIAEGPDSALSDFLRGLARRQVLVREAESAGLRPPRDSLDTLVEDARLQLRGAARSLGLLEIDRAPGEDLEIAVHRAVLEALAGNLSGATRVVPLGLVSFQLREGRSTAVYEAGVGQVILQVAEIRAARQLSPAEESAPVPDTVG